MFFFKYYKQAIVKHDLINTFFYANPTKVPSFKKLVLNFGSQKSNFRQLISSLLALELISSKKSNLTKSNHVNILLKIKKGNPVGCKIILKKELMYSFYLRLITSIFPKIKKLQKNQQQKNLKVTKAVSVRLQNSLVFTELESQYQFFKSIPSLDITLITNCNSQRELFFLLKASKFFI